MYLSEYDNVDRRILFSEETCSGSGVEIVPMTVLEFAYNSQWIIAKSGNKRTGIDIHYWIIKNGYEVEPTVEVNSIKCSWPAGPGVILQGIGQEQNPTNTYKNRMSAPAMWIL
jgi:hypothetical protein